MELSPSKRSRSINIHTSTVSCVVDECNADLTQCREYHRRHKVCERHSKAVTVLIGGLNQRFCQQCSRFHTLAEFDEVKRSCRKRLDGHNRRRRKSHIDSGSLISIRKGSTRMLSPEKPIEPFNDHSIHLPLNDFHRHNYVESSSSLTANREGSNHFQYLQSEPTLATTNTDRAFSLLSLPPPLSQRTPTMQPVPCGLDQYETMKQMDHEAGVCDFNRNNSDTTMQLDGAFHDELGGSSPIGTQQQTPPFEWH